MKQTVLCTSRIAFTHFFQPTGGGGGGGEAARMSGGMFPTSGVHHEVALESLLRAERRAGGGYQEVRDSLVSFTELGTCGYLKHFISCQIFVCIFQ